MTVANLTVKTTSDGDGIVVNFPINFDLKEKEVVKVYLIDELTVDSSTPSGFAEALLVETTHYTFDAVPIPTVVQMITAPTTDEKLRVERVSPLTQPDNLLAGVDANETIETRVDKLTHQSQEQDARISENFTKIVAPTGASSTAANVPDWVTATAYLADQLVIRSLVIYRVVSAHTSNVFSTDLSGGLLELLQGVKGDTGSQGDPGTPGANGSNGSQGIQGLTGSAGANGIFSQIASQGEAQAGTDNTKGMTPLRTAEAITQQVDKAGIVTNTSVNLTQTNDISSLKSRVTILESLIQQSTGKFAGQQVLLNTQAVAIPLIGSLNGGADDKGFAFSRDSAGAEFAEVMVYFRRKTDTEDRFSSANIVMQFVKGGWLIGRKGTDQLDFTLDLDGVVLSIHTTTGQVSYTSDTMAGTNHDTQSLVAWLGQEISKC